MRHLFIGLLLAIWLPTAPAPAQERDITLVVLGDSLSAGYRLAPGEAFPERLGVELRRRGYPVKVINAGVSGDTSRGGLARLDWSVPPEADVVIVELGANDALRGVNPAATRQALGEIVRRLTSSGKKVLLAGMMAPRNLGPRYAKGFDHIYPDLAAEYGVLLYPFFLDGVATVPGLNLADGIHPNARGIDVIVERIMPSVEKLIRSVQAERSEG